ncbi:MAG: CoA-binding protein [Smithella sp. SDB]|nr:MAG: CoA-binding protein [Smithella sp. SDB]
MAEKRIIESINCFIHHNEPRDEEVTLLLKKARTIAIVGLSDTPTRDSHSVALYMMEKGYKIIPVNPKCSEILGEKSYPDLLSIPDKVDIVDIFRKTEFIAEIVDEAIKIKAGAVWMQLDLYHEQAARKAREAGLTVIESKCIKIEHAVLLG